MTTLPPTLPPVEMSSDGGFNPDFNNPNTAGNMSTPPAPNGQAPHGNSANANSALGQDGASGAAASPQAAGQPAGGAPQAGEHKSNEGVAAAQATQKEVHDILYSDIGVNTLLVRLKASIASARDFASFLKRRGALEEEHSNSLEKLSRMTLENINKADVRHESYSRQFDQVMRANEQIAKNGSQFGLTLHMMHENLLQLTSKMEGGRKTWKQTGLAAEKKVQDAEALAEKAKAKYYSLAEDLDRVKTGDGSAGRKFGFKGPKSSQQHEEELQRKVQAADADYLQKVQTAQGARRELLSATRPQVVSALTDLIKEADAALTMEMQKYASFQEKLIVNNGQVICPQPLKGSEMQAPPSMNQLIYRINNDKDFDEYILKHRGKVPSVRTELEYKKHPSLAPTQSQPSPVAAGGRRPSMQAQAQAQPPPSFPTQQQRPQSMQFSSPPYQQPHQHPPYQAQPPPQQPSYQQNYTNTGFSHQQQHQPPQHTYPGAVTYSPVADNPYSQPQPPAQQFPSGPAAQINAKQATGVMHSKAGPAPGPPLNPVFGVNLEELFARDGSPVPMVVYQCIAAVDTFGLEVEGIYRIPGTTSHIQQMKALFDNDSSRVDFRNPEAFQHDVNSVAGLLKQFFRELPDPLLTGEFYQKFIDAARIEDDTMRRDSMHALINALPDPNYATLRALVLHLHRVAQAAEANRMSSANLGICWAPSIMGPHVGNNMADAGLQAKVIITILDNALQIFDED